MSPSPIREPDNLPELVDASLAEAGLPIRGFVPTRALREALDSLPAPTRAKYGTDRALGAVAVALPYSEGPGQPPDWAAAWLEARPGPLAKIAAFARANWYRETVRRLKQAVALARGSLATVGDAAGDWRCLANSGLPEKRLALAAGIGSLGRQGLVMIPGAGPACVLGILLLPFETGASICSSQAGDRAGGDRAAASGRSRAGDGAGEPPAFGESCGDCRACVEACPTGALSGGGFERLRCIQHWAAVPGPLPAAVEAAWGDRLYGCELCLSACPRYHPDPAAATDLGLLGLGLPAEWFLVAEEAEIRGKLHDTALGLSWMSVDAFRRNAALALRSGK